MCLWEHFKHSLHFGFLCVHKAVGALHVGSPGKVNDGADGRDEEGGGAIEHEKSRGKVVPFSSWKITKWCN